MNSLRHDPDLSVIRRVMLVLALVVASAALADTTSGPTNALPRPDVVGQNGLGYKELSHDPQIAQCVFDATGTTAATTSFTVFKDASHFTCTSLRGNTVGNSTNGTITLNRSGLYRVNEVCNGTGTNGNTMTQDAAWTVDDTNYTTISGTQAIGVALTADLEKNMGASGYVSVSTSQAAAGTFHVVMRGKNSANTTTCAAGGGLIVERVDSTQPLAFP
jgi:hypothetical protein